MHRDLQISLAFNRIEPPTNSVSITETTPSSPAEVVKIMIQALEVVPSAFPENKVKRGTAFTPMACCRFTGHEVKLIPPWFQSHWG